MSHKPTGEYDYIISQGATFREGIYFCSYDVDTEIETPIDLTGYTARMKIRVNEYDINALIELTTENGGIIIDDDPTTGIFQLFISDSDTEAIEWTNGVYDLELKAGAIDSDADVYRILQGKITVDQEVTR